MKTAAICIIGTEILKGQASDTNGPYFTKSLYRLGFNVKKISILPDDLPIIIEELNSLTKSYDIVLTFGATGFSHDDVIYEALSRVFNVASVPNDKLSELQSKMTLGKAVKTPENCVLIECSNFKYCTPIVKIENVYMFPGCKSSVEHRFRNMQHVFRKLLDEKLYLRNLCVECPETEVVLMLQDIRKKFDDRVTIWSYVCSTYDNRTEISIESKCLKNVLGCETYLKEMFCNDNIPSNKYYCHVDEVYEAAKSSQSIKNAIQVIEECYTKYNPSEVFLSFNGGKDCTVLLHLATIVGSKMFPNEFSLQCLYIKPDDTFEEVEHFIEDTIRYYSVDLITLNYDIKRSLQEVISKNSGFKAVLMGTRRTDPYSKNLNHFQMTDVDWPQVMRVSPILDWSYSDVWNYLRSLTIPYCSLYDQGFTSLGSKSNTKRNPALLANQDYLPAYMLRNGDYERKGRESSCQ